MTNSFRAALRGRIAVFMLAALSLGGLLAFTAATRPAPAAPTIIHWGLFDAATGAPAHA